MLSLNIVMIATKQPAMLVDFYAKVLGQTARMVDEENGFWGWQVGSVTLAVLGHSEMGGPTKDPGRVMLNFETTQVKEEFERLKALGAAVVAEPYQVKGDWVATLADPEGNYFQLLSSNPFRFPASSPM